MGPDKCESNSQIMAVLFATHYSSKTAKLRDKRCNQPTRNPVTRFRDWLSRKETSTSTFSLHTIIKFQLVSALTRLKSGKMLPSDNIDCCSLKLVTPVLLPSRLHFVNCHSPRVSLVHIERSRLLPVCR